MAKGNPNRCRVCGRLASKDRYCRKCREKQYGKKHLPLQRDTFMPSYGRNINKSSFFSESFPIEKDECDFRTKGWDR